MVNDIKPEYLAEAERAVNELLFGDEGYELADPEFDYSMQATHNWWIAFFAKHFQRLSDAKKEAALTEAEARGRLEGLEEAANRCDEAFENMKNMKDVFRIGCEYCAAAIRALKTQKQGAKG